VKEISNKDPPQQGSCDHPESDTAKLQPSDQVTYAYCKVNSHFGILSNEFRQPFHVPFLYGGLALMDLLTELGLLIVDVI
jgi:hypothetical protein